MIEVRHHISRIYVGRDGVPEGAKVTAEVQQVPSHEDGLLAFDTILTITPRPKRYVLPMPGTDYHNIQMHGNAQYYAIKGTENWRPDAIALGTDDAVKHGYTVTQADIDAAPAWVKAIKPVEVTDDEV